ncbi:hypothetical protein [Methylobacterium sp. 77]|uniref:ABC transporter permease subunit n=1 Tax=Methylobacterium sp. 77 TaxID=1101192 RepID=UPI00036B4D35|nr:hypothetical protein [Methylobacterium sp. 77]
MVEGARCARVWLCGALLLVACLLQPAVAAAPGFDRAGFAASLCGDGAGQGRALDEFIRSSGETASEDLAAAGALLRGLLDRRLICVGYTAILLDKAGLSEGREVTTGAVRSIAGGRSPVLGLRQRALVETASGLATLIAGETVELRLKGLAAVERRMAGLPDAVLMRAQESESDAGLKAAIGVAAQGAALSSPDPTRRLAAIRAVAEAPSGAALSRLSVLKGDPAYRADPGFRAALDAGIARVERAMWIGRGLAVLYNGLSFASILFMAAAGLAIIFGLMGVINLAQGEFIMVGAYAAYGVQEAFRRFAPGFLDLYLIAAIPVAFLAAALVGIAIEALILRHLYRRPLMSLLATWAVSLFLINLVRVVFGSRRRSTATRASTCCCRRMPRRRLEECPGGAP